MNKKIYKLQIIFLLSAIFILSSCDKGQNNLNYTNDPGTNNITSENSNTSEKLPNVVVNTKKEEKDYPELEEKDYILATVPDCDLSGGRLPNAKVDIGFGDREYWAYTNEYGQLVRVEAKEIILQDEVNEEVTDKGRYCRDEAKVPGTERSDLDEGHVIADSLGGVSNAYNITPQNSTLNRHGDQAYMEKVIRDAGGAKDFVAIIEYPNNETQIPSYYEYHYTVKGNRVNERYPNGNPEKYVENKKEIANNNNIKAYVEANGRIIGNKNSMIYHTPDKGGYKKVLLKNAEFFETKEQAEKAGYRPAKN